MALPCLALTIDMTPWIAMCSLLHKHKHVLIFVIYGYADSKMLLTACDDMHSHLYDVEHASLVEAFSGVKYLLSQHILVQNIQIL